MARKRSEFLGAFGTAFQVLKALTDEVLSLGGDDEDLRRIETDSGLRRKLAELIMGGKQAVGNIFKVTVDYSRSLAEMIAAGKYNWVNPDITEKHFPSPAIPVGLPAQAELNLELAHFNRCISSDNAIVEFKKMGLRPATLLELLAFGERYPNEQRKYPIVALGSVWEYWGGGYVPYLWSCADERYLGLDWFECGWCEGCRFLAVREV